MAKDVMKLSVWKGDWGLPSVDPNCLAVLAYCKFSRVPVQVLKTGNPWFSPTGKFPVLHFENKSYSRVSDILTLLRKESWGSDFELSTRQSADVLAFSAMLEERLLPALLYLWWMDNKTFVDVTQPWYANVLPFPLSLFHLRKQQKAAVLRVMLTKGGDYITDNETEAKVYKEAKECLNLLSYKLAEKPFMFGALPSSLDALVFGYLAPILKAPLTNSQLRTHLLQCENLCRMVNNILTSFFPSVDPEPKEEENKQESAGETSKCEQLQFPGKGRNMILAAVFAACTMLGYALIHGLVQVTLADSNHIVIVGSPDSNQSVIVGSADTPQPGVSQAIP